MKKPDWAIREEKRQMLDSVAKIQKRYSFLDDYRYALQNDLPAVEAAISKYGQELKNPLMKFFAGDILEEVATTAHNDFLKSMAQYIRAGRLTVNAGVSARLLDSLQQQVLRNIDALINSTDEDLRARASEFKAVAAESAQAAVLAQSQLTQLNVESLTRRTTGADDLQKAWIDLQNKYGGTDTVKYRNGAHYPLNTYLDQRANTTATDLHVATTQYEAANSGVYTGKITVHGATDSCRPWEGKIVFFTSAGRDILSKLYPQTATWKTVDEIKADKNTHLWKFNCTHGITAYPIQFFDKQDAEDEIGASETPTDATLSKADAKYRRSA